MMNTDGCSQTKVTACQWMERLNLIESYKGLDNDPANRMAFMDIASSFIHQFPDAELIQFLRVLQYSHVLLKQGREEEFKSTNWKKVMNDESN